jgi:hypothetical protein
MLMTQLDEEMDARSASMMTKTRPPTDGSDGAADDLSAARVRASIKVAIFSSGLGGTVNFLSHNFTERRGSLANSREVQQ